MDFFDTTTELLKCFTAAEIAEAIGCSPQSVKQARMKPTADGYRPPPPGWEAPLRALARKKSVELAGLEKRIG